MTTSRKIGCLLAIAFGFAASGVQAQYGYQDPYYGNDRYDDRYDTRYDDRYDDRYGRRTVRCESRDRRTNYCNVDIRGGVRLVEQMSDRRCIRGSTWGANSRGIWVTDGCRGRFELGSGGGQAYGQVYGQPYGRLMRCESNDSRTRYCNADVRYGVQIVRQLSRSSCIEGRTWGATRNGVWVSRGCRAEFRVGDRYEDRYGTTRY